MATVEENKSEKRGRMLEAAQSLFTQKGIKTTTIDEVVRLAGVAKGTFYLYFRDKYDLLDQIVLQKVSDMIAQSIALADRKAAEREIGDVEYIRIFLDSMIDCLAREKQLVPLLIGRINSCFKLALQSTGGVLHDGIDKLVEAVARHGYSKRDGEMHIYMLTAMIGSVCCEALLSGAPYTIEELRPQIHSTVDKLLA